MSGAQPSGGSGIEHSDAADAVTITRRVKEHYDACSTHYQGLWGQHIHHGLWRTETESKEEAQENLISELLQHASLPAKPAVLDVGCGVGGTCIALAVRQGASCTGVTLSSTQVAMAVTNASKAGVSATTRFMEGNGEELTALLGAHAHGTYDAVWITEALSHFEHKQRFFEEAVRMLKPGGKLALADWFRDEHLTPDAIDSRIKPIESGMLLPRLDTLSAYVSMAISAGMRLVWVEDVSARTAKTWDIGIAAIANPSTWGLAWTMGRDFIAFLEAFAAMRAGYASGAFRYACMVAEKPGAVGDAGATSTSTSSSGGGSKSDA